MAGPRRLLIELVEDPNAPLHRRWSGHVELPDGTAGRLALGDVEDFEAQTRDAILDTVCQCPDCEEPCAPRDCCSGCGAHVCTMCDLLYSTPPGGAHPPQAHWIPDLAIAWLGPDPDSETLIEHAVERLIMDHYPKHHRLTAEVLTRAHARLPDHLSPVAELVLALRHAVLELADDPENELARRRVQTAWKALSQARGLLRAGDAPGAN